jgi:hypothetical protein
VQLLRLGQGLGNLQQPGDELGLEVTFRKIVFDAAARLEERQVALRPDSLGPGTQLLDIDLRGCLRSLLLRRGLFQLHLAAEGLDLLLDAFSLQF